MAESEAKPEEGSSPSALTTPAPSATSLTEGATSEPPAWMAQLSADLKADKILAQHRTIPELGKAFLALKGKVDKSVVLPGEQATKEEWDAYYKALGRPDKPTEYKIEKAKLPEGLIDANLEKAFLETAHNLGLSQPQVAKLYEWYGASMAKAVAERQKIVQTTTEDANAAARKKYGDAHATKMAHASRFLTRFGNERVKLLLNRSNLGNDPDIIDMIVKAGEAIAEAPVVEAETVSNVADFGGRNRDTQLANILYGKKGA